MDYTIDKQKLALLRTGVLHVQTELSTMLKALHNNKLNPVPDPLVDEHLTEMVDQCTAVYSLLVHLSEFERKITFTVLP